MKNNILAAILVIAFSFAYGLFIGWLVAGTTIANECKRLEGFYVGNSAFVCKEK